MAVTSPVWAVLDLGTNSVKLLVARVASERPPQVLLHDVRITRMGQGLAASGRISAEGVARTLEAVRELLAQARSFHPQGVAAVGMEAFRRASNRDEVAHALQKELGFSLTVLTGDQEAALGREGVLRDLGPDPQGRSTLVVDIGGGSTELALSNPVWAISLPLGAVVVSETFLRSDPPGAPELEAMHQALRDQISQSWQSGAGGHLASGLRVVAVGGTATSYATMHLGLTTYDSHQVHRLRLRHADLVAQTARLAALPLEQRRQVPGLHPDRAAVILGGGSVLAAVLEVVGADEVVVSEANLLHALVVRQALAAGLP